MHSSLCQFTHSTTRAFIHAAKPMKHGASNKLPSTRQYQMRNHAGGAPRGIPESATTPWFPGNPLDISHIAAFI